MSDLGPAFAEKIRDPTVAAILHKMNDTGSTAAVLVQPMKETDWDTLYVDHDLTVAGSMPCISHLVTLLTI